MPQARAVYSNGATTDACPCRNASVIASWPPNPVTARPATSGQWACATPTHWGHANAPAPSARKVVVQKTRLALESVRVSTRPVMADTA
ncbi:hypothetical protein D3C71_1996330 [compost metagenome]